MNEFKLNESKAINSLLYICQSQGGSCDMYNLLKVVFFADSKHLFKYGRPITGDTMFSMKFGPVPSKCYDLVKEKGKYFNTDRKQKIVESKTEARLDVFSESDIECLDESINENTPLPFHVLRDKSHTRAYEKTKAEKGQDKPISFLDIAKEDGNVSEDMLKYISSRFEY